MQDFLTRNLQLATGSQYNELAQHTCHPAKHILGKTRRLSKPYLDFGNLGLNKISEKYLKHKSNIHLFGTQTLKISI